MFWPGGLASGLVLRELQSDSLGLRSIEEIGFDRLLHISAEFLPCVALSHDVFAEAPSGKSALCGFRDVENKLTVMRFRHGVLKARVTLWRPLRIYKLPLGSPRSSLGGLAGGDSGVEVGGFFARDGERGPFAGLSCKVFGQENDLANVIDVMRHLAVDGLRDRMRLGADGHRARQVGIA